MGWHGIWGTACVACQMWHDGVHGQTEDLRTHPSSLPPLGQVLGRNPLFAFHSTGFQRGRGQTSSETTQQVHDPQPAQYQLSFISSSSILVRASCPALVRPRHPTLTYTRPRRQSRRGKGTGQDIRQAGQPYDHDDGDPDVTTEMPHQPKTPSPSPCRQVKRGLHRAPALSHLLYCNITCHVVPWLRP